MPAYRIATVSILLCLSILGSTSTLSADSALRRGNGPEPDSMDPHVAQSLGAHNILRDLFEGLVLEAADGTIAPAAAASWSVGDDGTLYRFKLREDGRWSNGETLTAHDFVYALKRAANPATASTYAHLLNVIAGFKTPEVADFGVVAVSEFELSIRLHTPTPHLLRLLTLPVAFPLHEPSVENHGNRFTRPENLVSNGPYRLAYWRVNERIQLTKNPHFRNAPALSPVDYFHFDNPDSELQRFRADELDITDAIPPGRYQWVRENLGDQLRVAPYYGTFFLGFNLTREPFAGNRELRAALSLAVDRDKLVNAVLKSGEVPVFGVIPPGIDGYKANHLPLATMSQDQRERRARELYEAAGYGRANPLQVEIRFNTSPLHQRTMLAVSAMWKQVLGVQTRLINEEWKVFVSNRRQRTQTELFRWGWIGDYSDPVTFLDLFRSGQALNNAGFANNEFDELLDQAGSLQGTERMEKLMLAESLVMDAHAVLPLYGYVSKHLVTSRLSGWQDHLLDRHPSAELSLRDQ